MKTFIGILVFLVVVGFVGCMDMNSTNTNNVNQAPKAADLNGDGTVTADEYNTWLSKFGNEE